MARAKPPSGKLDVKLPGGGRLSVVRSGEGDLFVLSYPLRPIGAGKGLTPSEVEVLEGLLLGKSNAEIAHDRRASAQTVTSQVKSVFQKMGVRSRGELAALQRRRDAAKP